MGKLLHVDASVYRALAFGDTQAGSSLAAALDISASDEGVLIHRLSTLQISSIPNPPTSLLLFNIDLNEFVYFDGNDWIAIGAGSSVEGPTGPIGPTGPTGPSGIGPTGPTGPAGNGSDLNLNLYAENGSPANVNKPIAGWSMSIALGINAYATAHGSLMHSAGSFASPGDAQAGSYLARIVTSNDSFNELFLNGASDKILLEQNTTMTFTAIIVGSSMTTNERAIFEMRGCIDRRDIVLSTKLVGSVSKKSFLHYLVPLSLTSE